MRTAAAVQHDEVRRRAVSQAGVVSRRQLLEIGLTDKAIASHVAAGRWRRWASGVVLTHQGEPEPTTSLWAALLTAPPGALVSHESAAWLHGLLEEPPDTAHVRVVAQAPHGNRSGVRIHRSRVPARTRVLRGLPTTSVEDTVLDLVGTSGSDAQAISWVMLACQRRRTTSVQVLRALRRRAHQRRAALVRDLCTDVVEGAQTPLELRYLRDVERAHRLPRSRKAVREQIAGRLMFRDLEYSVQGVVVELDGRRGHEDPRGMFRDRGRDNLATRTGRVTLRYGWHETTQDPCGVAAEVAAVLSARGWTGTIRPCSADCVR